MQRRDLTRWLSTILAVGAGSLAVAACGGGGSGSGASYRDASVGDSSLAFGDAGSSTCKPKTCQDLGFTCGKNSDTCGTLIDCGTCSGTEYCGGGGYSKCGGNIGLGADGGKICTPKTCTDFAPGTCGQQSDGCGSLTDKCGQNDAGGLCAAGQFCGGGGSGICGTGLDGGAGEAGVCTPKTCADFPAGTCGQQSDGCGGVTTACGTGDAGSLCPNGQFCGGGGTGLCGTGPTADGGSGGMCTPLTCANLGNPCGAQGDGCGGQTPVCTTCPSGQWCGGGGPNQCGNGFQSGDGGDGGLIPPCVPKTCANFPSGTCGEQSDGCGGLTANCNSPCPGGQYCGGGGSGLCGTGLPSDAGTCTPWTCSHYPANACGQQSDGCGGLTANCGATCPGSQYCGGGGPGLCGTGPVADAGACTKKTCADFPGTCGQHSDGCGGLTANCGTCTNPQYCGGGGAGVCGGNNHLGPDGGVVAACTPATCQSLGYVCGYASDGCGGTIGPCGPTCTLPLVCGGGGKPGQCGSNLPCTGLCTQQVTCAGGVTTTLTGTVVASTAAKYLGTATYGDPVPDVVVYIPTSTVTAFTPRASETTTQQCTTCGADVSGNPLVTTTTNYDGTFTLSNVPVGNSIPLVIQLGRWRRQFTVNISNKCVANQVNDASMPTGILKMPNNQSVGDIPLTAISTGQVDAMECVLLKMGIDTSEFTDNTGTGRVHIYQGNGASATTSTGTTPDEVALMGRAAGRRTTAITGTWNSYDQMLFPCWGAAYTKTATELANLITYADTGGHFFATHFSYTWLNTNAEFQGTANWDVGANGNIASTTGIVSPLPPTAHPAVFVNWLNYVHALSNFTPNTTPPTPPNPADVTITQARHDVDSVAGGSVSWIAGTDPAPGGGSPSTMLLHYTFDTPVTPPSGGHQCGHQIYSDFHVSNSNDTSGYNFPADADTECDTSPLTPQERILEFMIWDLSSCVPPQQSASCTPATCSNFPAGTCGQQGDGCGGLTANCGSCPSGQTCGGGGIAAQCGSVDAGTCTVQTCATYPVGTCGQQSDGCGSLTANCNNCPSGQTCGGAGVSGVCGTPPSCTAKTCASFPAGTCGQQSDGCGGLTANCACPSGQTCGGAGVSGQCGTPPSSSTCVPLTCSAYAGICGQQSDGCGGLTANCNPCPPPATCGGGGVAGQCGTPPDASSCIPQTCSGFPGVCGVQSDGCGGLTPYCNPCTAPQTCGGGGTPGVCAAPPPPTCTPLTCSAYPTGTCGQQSDGCGSLTVDCFPCTPPQTCGGGGTAGQCGTPPVGSCVPKTCVDYPGVCGQQSNGCGGLTDFCNPCPGTQTCGGGGTTGVCGSGGQCQPKKCTDLGLNCGPAGDGCGGLLDCGTCPSGQSCGTTTAGVCSGNVPQ